MTAEVEPLDWWPLASGQVLGVVALVDRDRGYWKAYIGLAHGDDAATDAAAIALRGAHAGELVARALARGRFDDLEFRPT